MSARKPLTETERKGLALIAKRPRKPSECMGNPVLTEAIRQKLRQRGYVKYERGGDIPYGRWAVTDAGLAELGSEQ